MKATLLLAAMAAAAAMAQFALAAEASWRAGAARASITPRKPLWMTGYGSRVKVSEGTAQELYVRVLALDDGGGRPAVLVCADVLGFPRQIGDAIAEQARRRFGVPRDRLMLSATHTHGGPALAHPSHMLYGVRATQAELADVEQYARELERTTVETIGAALKDLRGARVRFGHGQAGFAMNRRAKMERGYVIAPAPGGPVDHDVPVLRVDSREGRMLAVVFGYACHNTTVGGDCYEFHGDYAGHATDRLEKDNAGAVAMFVSGCGGDANPEPRGSLELAGQHGRELAAAVQKVIGAPMGDVQGPMRAAYEHVPLPFAPPPTAEQLRQQLNHADIYLRWQAAELLKVIQKDGGLPRSYPCPLQVWRFGDDLTLVAIGGEVVVDYALRLKKELGAQRLWVAGYCNDVFAYVPSERVLAEGGYEAATAMIYYVQPGPFAPGVEEAVISGVHRLLARTAAAPTGP